ncbi:Hypothetical predicted protein [Mytilus galloprovincialis]|uniref:Uncharacterized protein n=1 Tax=Mytilus galloprovincialis TaxID=29158 RepID=A0A8B6FXD1_MYTGA|nr:Hypothetical predicted protein [Mytilus galloprovincialis]
MKLFILALGLVAICLIECRHISNENRIQKRWIDWDDRFDWNERLDGVDEDIGDAYKNAVDKVDSGLSKAGDAIGDAFDDIFGR